MRVTPRSAEIVFPILLAALSLSSAWKLASRDAGIDAYQFWVVGQALHAPGPAHVYSPSDRERLGGEYLEAARRTGKAWLVAVAERRKVLETYSTPFLYTAFGAFSTGDYETSLRNERVLILLCLVAGVLALARLAGLSWPFALGAVALFAFWFSPFTSDLRVGNVNSIQFAALAAYAWIAARGPRRARDLLGGALLGLLVFFKPNAVFIPLVLATGWALERRARRLAHSAGGAVAGAAFALLASAWSFGSFHAWTEWASALRNLPPNIITVDLGNFALSRLAADVLGLDLGPVLTILVLAAAAAALWLRHRRRSDASVTTASATQDDLVGLALGCLLVVLTSGLAWLHYFVFTIPALLVLARPREISARTLLVRRSVLALLFLGLSVQPLLDIGVPVSQGVAGVTIAGSSLIVFAAIVRECVAAGAGETSVSRATTARHAP
jgi:hypothetical protein